MKHTILELVSLKINPINSESSEDKAKVKAQHLQNDAGNAFGGLCAKSNQERQLPSGLTILSYMFSLAVYWFSPRQRVISQIVCSIRKVSKNKAAKSELDSNCIVLSYTGKECEVSPYSSEYKAVWNILVVTGATVW